jgi:REP element-mobilizing transposase RayT
MASTLVAMNTHIVFHSKTQSPMRKDDLPRIHQYIGGIVRGMDSIPLIIGGTENHVHILATLPKTIALSEFVREIKSKSSYWMKKIDAFYRAFAWQEGYGAFSVSSSKVDVVKGYIANQEEHHKRVTFKDEYEQFLKAYHIQYEERYLETD